MWFDLGGDASLVVGVVTVRVVTIPGPQLPGPGLFHQILAVSNCFRTLPEASIYLTNPCFEINDLKSMIWNPRLLMITNAYQPRFEISDY